MKRILSLLWRAKRGFTLIEILIAVTLLLVIAVAAFSTFRGGTAAWRQGTAHAQRDAEARATLEMMTRELSKAILVAADGIYQIDFVLTAGNIYFIGSVEYPGIDQPDIMKVRYSFEPGAPGETGKIKRAADNIDTDIMNFFGSPTPATLASGITELTFEFFKDGFPGWRSSWDSRTTTDEGGTISETAGTLPDAVRIKLTSDPEGPGEGLAAKEFLIVTTLPLAR